MARGARLVRVIVPESEAAWVYPGVCYNSIGYWHVGGARVVYTEHGQERSFGIASLISWRGVWYVVHFGEVLRPVVTGVVDQPAEARASPARQAAADSGRGQDPLAHCRAGRCARINCAQSRRWLARFREG